MTGLGGRSRKEKKAPVRILPGVCVVPRWGWFVKALARTVGNGARLLAAGRPTSQKGLRNVARGGVPQWARGWTDVMPRGRLRAARLTAFKADMNIMVADLR
jgi:hypothetical protein